MPTGGSKNQYDTTRSSFRSARLHTHTQHLHQGDRVTESQCGRAPVVVTVTASRPPAATSIHVRSVCQCSVCDIDALGRLCSKFAACQVSLSMAEMLVDVSIERITQLYAIFREVLMHFLGGV